MHKLSNKPCRVILLYMAKYAKRRYAEMCIKNVQKIYKNIVLLAAQ